MAPFTNGIDYFTSEEEVTEYVKAIVNKNNNNKNNNNRRVIKTKQIEEIKPPVPRKLIKTSLLRNNNNNNSSNNNNNNNNNNSSSNNNNKNSDNTNKNNDHNHNSNKNKDRDNQTISILPVQQTNKEIEKTTTDNTQLNKHTVPKIASVDVMTIPWKFIWKILREKGLCRILISFIRNYCKLLL